MITTVARFAKDSYSLWQCRLPALKKAAVWSHLLYPSKRVLGFEVSSFDRSTLAFLYREVFARQQYYFRSTTAKPVIYDCGANIGMATFYFKWLYPGAQIHAFEPDPKTFTLLQRNVAQNHLTAVDVYNCALWDQNGTVELFIDPGIPGSLLMSTDSARCHGERIQVPSRKLSDFIQGPVDCVKIDVEGAEHHILCDLVVSGKIALVNQLIVEYHHRIANQHSCLAAFLKRLEDSGFEYQVQASVSAIPSETTFQDIIVRAYR
jgi:FkbM family methyltransferase